MNTKAEKALVDLVLYLADRQGVEAMRTAKTSVAMKTTDLMSAFESAYAEGPRAEHQALPREKPQESE
jgi:hypothetical protein